MDELGTIWLPSPGRFWANRYGLKAKYIIVHGTAGGGTAQQIAEWLGRPNVPLAQQSSVHYIVGQDGTVVQTVLEKDAAWGNGGITGQPGTSGDGVHYDSWWNPRINPNLLTISIEHVKPDTQNQSVLTPVQQAASFQLIANICQRTGIPMRAADAQGGITGHFSMDPINRSHCPGTYPWVALFTFLVHHNHTSSSPSSTPILPAIHVPTGWHDDGKTLTAPNETPVVLGFREWVLTHSWNPDNWPLEAEIGLTQLEWSNPALGGGTQQIFRWTMLGWTPQRDIFEEWIGQEHLALMTRFAQAQNALSKALKLLADLPTPSPSVPPAPSVLDDLQHQISNLNNALMEANEKLGTVTSLQQQVASLTDQLSATIQPLNTFEAIQHLLNGTPIEQQAAKEFTAL